MPARDHASRNAPFAVRISRGRKQLRRIGCDSIEDARAILATERCLALCSSHIVRGSPEDGWLVMRGDPRYSPVPITDPHGTRLDIIDRTHPVVRWWRRLQHRLLETVAGRCLTSPTTEHPDTTEGAVAPPVVPPRSATHG